MEEITLIENLLATLRDYSQRVEQDYKDRLIADDKKATGTLINSISTQVKTSNGLVYDVVINLADYWRYVEEGRKPGKFPPPDAILKWIKVKPVIPRPYNGKVPTQKQLAFLIGRKIATEGIEPGNQLKETVDTLNAEYIPKFEAALKKDFDEYTIKVFEKIGKMSVY